MNQSEQVTETFVVKKERVQFDKKIQFDRDKTEYLILRQDQEHEDVVLRSQ